MPYVGADFPNTSPDETRSYTLDFVNGMSIFFTEVITLGGSATPGDQILLTLNNPSLAKLSETVSYTVRAGDTLNSIAAALAALINGDDILNDAQITASVLGAVVTVQSPGQNVTVISAITLPATAAALVTETVSIQSGAAAGELIQSAVWSSAVFTGVPDATSRIVGSPTIAGSRVTTLAGSFVGGAAGPPPAQVYRLTCVASTNQGQVMNLFSHVACVLPQ